MVINRSPLRHQLANLPICVHHRCVVSAAEALTNLREAHLSQLSAKVHRYLASLDQTSRAITATDILDREAEVGSGLRHNHCSSDIRAG